MKLRTWLVAGGLGLVIAGGSGCAAARNFAVDETVEVIRPAQTNIVEVVTPSTNIITEAITNRVTGLVTNVTSTNVLYTTNLTPVVLPPVYYTNLALSDGLAKGVQGVGRLASNLGVPFADAIAGGLVGVVGLLFGWRNRTGRRKALEELDGERAERSLVEKARTHAEDAVAVLTQNLDTIREAALQIDGYKAHDAKVMKAIKAAQKLLNVHDTIATVRKSPRVLNDKS